MCSSWPPHSSPLLILDGGWPSYQRAGAPSDWQGILSLQALLHGQVIQVASGNTTTVYYINKQGDTHSPPLLYLAVQLWEWCLENHIFPSAIHISTHENVWTDCLSRTTATMRKWTLDQAVFLHICRRWGHLTVDAFATQFNTKCPVYFSRAGVGVKSQGDALMVPWTKHLFYMFPPFPLLLQIIVKIHHDKANVILVVPCWPRQPWFTMLTTLAADSMRLPSLPHLLTQHNGDTYHPDVPSLHLTAWRILPQ